MAEPNQVSAVDEPANRDPAPQPPIAAKLSHDGPVDVELAVGQRVVLLARSLPIHPDYKDARIVPAFDPEALALIAEELDASGYNYTGVRFLFEARRAGSTEVQLRTFKGEEVDEGRTSIYRLNVSAGP